MSRRRGEAGQASLELVALVPVLAAVALAVAALLAGHTAKEAADQAAVAAAIAELQGSDPLAAAKSASPGWTRTRVRISTGRVTVRVRPRLPMVIAGLVDAERSVVFSASAATEPGAGPDVGARLRQPARAAV